MSAIFGETLTFGQEKGDDVRLAVFGDEFYSRYENSDGFTAVYDMDEGLFCYADIHEGRFVSTGVPLTEAPPSGLRRHLKETVEVRGEKFAARRRAITSPPPAFSHAETMRTFGANNGLLEGRRLNSGQVRGLTILVEFQDVTSTATRDEVAEMLNGQNYTRNGNFCSVRDYYLLMSSGRLDYTNEVVGPFKLSRNRQYYASTLLVEEALNLAVAAGVDLTRFDSKGEGILDALCILYAGQTQYLGELWPHNSYIDLRRGGIRTNLYLLTSMGRSGAELSIGTFCHESGHLLCRFPDLYDYGNRDGDRVESAGIGAYCLMGSGNHLNYGRTPSPICGYLRDLAGWCDNQVSLNQPGVFATEHGDYRTVMKYRTGRLNDYFIIENRSKLGLNQYLPSSGLAVFHCDTLGSNEFQEGSATRHYQCALLQADGHLDLERNVNQGDGNDLFGAVAGTALSNLTNPSSRSWDGADSGLVVSAITPPGQRITFAVGREPAAQVARGEASPALAIPDNDPAGVKSAITIGQAGRALQIKVSVDITHTYIGDLVVELVAPTGGTAILHDRAGGNRDNLIVTFDSASLPSLGALAGTQVQGDWTLKVKDVAGQDIGKLNTWSIEIGLQTSDQTVRGETSPALAIPDNDPAGIGSAISFTQAGTVRQLKVEVAITHTYIGDLRVELLSPTGRRALLHSRLGGGKDDLAISYDSAFPSSPLATLVGQPVRGDWVLRVSDLAKRDIGKLDRWSIEITTQG